MFFYAQLHQTSIWTKVIIINIGLYLSSLGSSLYDKIDHEFAMCWFIYDNIIIRETSFGLVE